MISTREFDCRHMLAESQQEHDDDGQNDSLCAIHVEARQRLDSPMTKDELEQHVRKYLENIGRLTQKVIKEFQVGSLLEVWFTCTVSLGWRELQSLCDSQAHVEQIDLEHSDGKTDTCMDADDNPVFDLRNSELGVYIYKVLWRRAHHDHGGGVVTLCDHINGYAD